MKRVILTAAVCLFAASGLAQADVGELHGTIDLTFQSKYVWRGFDVYGDKSAIQPSIDLDLFGSGFGLNIAGHRANSSGYENTERWDYMLYYGNKLFEDEVYATNWRMAYVHYNYPDNSSHAASSLDLSELHWILSWPNALPVDGLVPSYVLVKLWPYNGGTLGDNASGWVHIFMLDYGLKVPGILPDTDEQVLRLHTELVYNDGVYPLGDYAPNVDSDWSNIVFGIETDFDLGNNLSFTPGLYQQVSMDKSVNDEDETWVSLSLKYKF